MNVRKTLKKYLIPHEENEYKPHLFREAAVGLISAIVIGIFAGTVFTNIYIKKSDIGAAVLPAVVYDLTNIERENQNESKLVYNEVLQKAAQMKANDMAEKGYFAHTSPEGITPWYWFGQAGYNFFYAGENLAVNFNESNDVTDAWMASPGHRANILNGKFTEIGIATAQGKYEGKNATFVVQLFATPSITKSQVSVEASASTAPSVPPLKTSEPKVAEASTTALPEKHEEVKVIKSDNEFLSVETTDPNKIPDTKAQTVEPKNRSNFLERYITNPSELMKILYEMIGTLVLIGLLLMTLVEIKIQQPRNIVYGIALLALIGGLFYVYFTVYPFEKVIVL